VLRRRADAGRVRATLIESDPGNVRAARNAAAGLPGVRVRAADAGDLASALSPNRHARTPLGPIVLPGRTRTGTRPREPAPAG
jgi:hypothetical protein